MDQLTLCKLEWRIAMAGGTLPLSEPCVVFDVTAVDSAGNVGEHNSLAIGTDGFPLISYHDTSNSDLNVVQCTDAACAGTVDVTAVDSAGMVGEFTSLAIGTDAFPVISYFDEEDSDLKVAHCTNVGCTNPFLP